MLDFMLASFLMFTIAYFIAEPDYLILAIKLFYKLTIFTLIKLARVILFVIMIPLFLTVILWLYLYIKFQYEPETIEESYDEMQAVTIRRC